MSNNVNNQGLLIVISGPAGAGKGTVTGLLQQTGDFVCSVSATTRAPRPGEIDGVHYRYISADDFRERIATGGMLEYTEYCGNYYGTPRREALEVLASGKNLILEIEVDGAMQVKRQFPEAVLIMLLPPSYAEQEARLRGRATETEEKILARLDQAKRELPHLPEYDYVVYNTDHNERACADDVLAIVRAERCATRRHPTDAQDYFCKSV